MEHSDFRNTLICLAFIYVASLVTAALVPDLIGKFEAFGLGTITGGLIGVLNSPNSKGHNDGN